MTAFAMLATVSLGVRRLFACAMFPSLAAPAASAAVAAMAVGVLLSAVFVAVVSRGIAGRGACGRHGGGFGGGGAEEGFDPAEDPAARFPGLGCGGGFGAAVSIVSSGRVALMPFMPLVTILPFVALVARLRGVAMLAPLVELPPFAETLVAAGAVAMGPAFRAVAVAFPGIRHNFARALRR